MDYMQGVDEEAFMASSMLQDAVIRQISIIGEARAHFSSETRAEHPDYSMEKDHRNEKYADASIFWN